MSERVVLTPKSNHKMASSCTGPDLITLLSRKVVGQSATTNTIVPYVYMYQSGLASSRRPGGVLRKYSPHLQTRAAVN